MDFSFIGQKGNDTGTSAWNGDIAEVILFDSVLTTDQQQNIELYLSDKWGTTSIDIHFNEGANPKEVDKHYSNPVQVKANVFPQKQPQVVNWSITPTTKATTSPKTAKQTLDIVPNALTQFTIQATTINSVVLDNATSTLNVQSNDPFPFGIPF